MHALHSMQSRWSSFICNPYNSILSLSNFENINNYSYYIKWLQQGAVTCRRTVQVCGFSVGAQKNWLITQHISRELAGGQRLQKVTARFDFQLVGCDSVGRVLMCIQVADFHHQ